MENASKALVIAGEVLIGIIILSLAVYVFVYYNNISVTYEKSQILQETEKFNSQFTKYLGQDVTIQEIVTLVHLAQEYNMKVDDNKIGNKNKNKVTITGSYIQITPTACNTNFELTAKSDEILIKFITLNQNKKFKCKKVFYDDDDGKVYQIVFQEINFLHFDTAW